MVDQNKWINWTQKGMFDDLLCTTGWTRGKMHNGQRILIRYYIWRNVLCNVLKEGVIEVGVFESWYGILYQKQMSHIDRLTTWL